jgi:hypothetical protein
MGKRTISAARWTHDTTFQEIIQLYGFLMMMDIFTLPGATYNVYWSYGSLIFPWTNTITIWRFKKICSILQLNLNATEVKGQDALHKTRLLLNILKKSLGVLLVPGSELS